jgi:hypothetical protein
MTATAKDLELAQVALGLGEMTENYLTEVELLQRERIALAIAAARNSDELAAARARRAFNVTEDDRTKARAACIAPTIGVMYGRDDLIEQVAAAIAAVAAGKRRRGAGICATCGCDTRSCADD